MSPRHIIARGIVFGLLAAFLCGGGFLLYINWYSGTDRMLPGVTVGEAHVGRMNRQEAKVRLTEITARGGPLYPGATGTSAGELDHAELASAQSGAAQTSAALRAGAQSWDLNLQEAGAVPDWHKGLRDALQIGRKGSLASRAFAFVTGLVHGHRVPLRLALKEDVIAARLEAIAKEVNRPAVDATYDFESDRLNSDVAGQELDVPASVAVVMRSLLEGHREMDLVVRSIPATVRADDLALAKRYAIAQFSTPILAADAGRVQNVSLAGRKISGVVLRPGQLFSFNEVVGPRDAEHGWAQANEIYQGEYVLGFGGGICQVSSTLYNAVLLAGLEVKQRFHHDRPLQYISPGRDATVAWNVLDFQFSNDTDAPLLIEARIVRGTPQQIEVKIYGPHPLESTVRIEESVLRYFPPDLDEIVDPTLPPGARKVVDEGNYGIEVQVYRVVGSSEYASRQLVSHDHYRPKAGKVKVGRSTLAPTETKTSQ